ncbi:MAG: AtpZ/AtpI family protein [Candidatus Acidiferrales bacterium]
MPSDDKPNANEPPNPELEKVKKYSTQTSLALELPFTIVGAVILGGALGYFLDRWLHTKMIFTLLLGGVGFYAGLREVLRRLDGTKSG